MDTSRAETITPRQFALINAAISVVAVGFLTWLIYFHQDESSVGGGSILPTINAGFNTASATLLMLGLRAIKAGRRAAHRQYMLSAIATSGLFLITYVYYHYSHGDTLFQGVGAIRVVYLAILASHVILSIGVLPLIMSSVYLALTDRLQIHKRLSKWTWGIWMYVSVTGVLVYLMLHVISW